MDIDAFGAAVRAARLRRKIRQKDFAGTIHVTPGYVYMIEHGAYPSLALAVEISKALGVSLDELTGTGLGGDAAELIETNKQLQDQLRAAQQDLAQLDACVVCGWWDGDGCRAQKDVRMGGNCFAWRGAERARLWEEKSGMFDI